MNWSKLRKILLTDCRILQALTPRKYKRQIFSSMLVILLFSSNTQAQTGEWQAVQSLRPGTRIRVKTLHPVQCVFQRATEDELTCERFYRVIQPPLSEVVFDRRSIREVRIETSDEANGTVGALIGAGAGIAIGVSTVKTSNEREGRSLLLGSVGAIIGWFFAHDFHIVHARIIYKR